MPEAFICDGVRTPFGRYGGALSSVRTDDLATKPLRALMERNTETNWEKINDVILGCANQAGEDNRNIARMALLLAGLPDTVSGATINRLCGSGLDATGIIVRAIKAGEAELGIAGGVESMSRSPFVIPKADNAFSRRSEIYDTTLGWRLVNPRMKETHGIDSMGETAENVALQFQIARIDQDAYALRSQKRAAQAQADGFFEGELIKVRIPQQKGDDILFSRDEHPRANSSHDSLKKLKPVFREGGSVTAGNAAGINDGAAALLIASEEAAREHELEPLARVVTTATVGVPPRIMGYGPAPASRKAMDKAGITVKDLDVIELNEAFASQVLAVLRDLGLPDDAEHVNPNGGAIAIGHPLGASGARLALTATRELHRRKGRYALCTMCIGVGQGIATILERV